jgi:hypothetical protein
MMDMHAHYARCRSGVGPGAALPPGYVVIGRDVPWLNEG